MHKGKHELHHRPELRHYILPTLNYYLKLIELPNLELETYLRQQLETNPLLEETPEESSGEAEDVETNTEDNEKTGDDIKDVEALNIVELFAEDSNISYGDRERQFDPMENVPACDDKLYDCLMRQARRKFKDRELEIAELVISNLEEDGHLTTAPEDLTTDGYDVSEIIAVTEKIRYFEPVGCAWREEKEALLTQLEVMGYTKDSIEYMLVDKYLESLKRNHYKNIMRELNVDEERFLKAKEVIMKLDPRPGSQCSSTPSRYVTPDFVVRWRDDKLVAHLNDEYMPRVRVRRQYLEILKNPKNVPSEQLDFIKQRVQAAHNLIIAIEQRRRSLVKIIDNILEYQREFFENGYNYLKPITMTDFARQLSVNPSTISRAIANKYLESPWGIHQLKFFFSPPVSHTDKSFIFKKIKEIVDNEDKSSPLSDTQIAKQLSRQGIIISRRTVSKYRDILRIPAHQFRRE